MQIRLYSYQFWTLIYDSTQGKKRKLSTEEHRNDNGHLNESGQSDQSIPTAKKPRQDSESTPKSASGRPKTPTQRDTRTHCDKVRTITVQGEGGCTF